MKQVKLDTFGLLIVNSTATIFQKVYSEKDFDINSRFVIGSVSKSFTALSILKLNISITDTLDKNGLNDYLDDKLLKELTVGELLNHTTGLDSFSREIVGKRGQFRYSNNGYALLGKIIEKVSGKTFNDYVKENIFDELDMKNSWDKYSDHIIDNYTNFLGAKKKYGGKER